MPRSDLKDIIGQRFGARVAVQYVGKKRWRTRCACGAEFVVDGADLRRRVYACNHVEADRFWSKVEKTDGCWLWRGSINSDGYGSFKIKGRTVKAHGYPWEKKNGQVPRGLELDHLCRNRACVRPDHLEPVTHAVNVQRGNLGRVTKERWRRRQMVALGGVPR